MPELRPSRPTRVPALFAVVLTLGLAVGISAGAASGGDPVLLDAGEGRHLLVSRAEGDALVLDAASSQFPSLGLEARAAGETGGDPLNGGRPLGAIVRWDEGDRAVWGLWVDAPTSIELSIRFSGAGDDARFLCSLDGRETPFTPDAEGRFDLGHRFAEAGLHELEIRALATPGRETALEGIEVRGDDLARVGVARVRWRPAAAHARFAAPSLREGARLWIMELDAVPGGLGFYAPVTTPFGYYGSTWDADGTVRPGINFSLWSFGRGAEEPPTTELSHLLAIGSPDADFGGFSHEGTGVKPRGFEPLAPRQRQAYALRVDPGGPFDTYTAYFYDLDEHRWRFYASGRKQSKRPVGHLLPGTFVEVPGPPTRQRTGIVRREIRCRGWVSADGGRWHRLTEMSSGDIDRATGLTHTDRGVDRGWFFLATGGWYAREGAQTPVALGAVDEEVPEFLEPGRTEALLRLPCEIAVRGASIEGGELVVEYSIRGVPALDGEHTRVTAYWGPEDGVTFSDRWAASTSVERRATGDEGETARIRIPDHGSGTLEMRLLLECPEGRFWSPSTVTARPVSSK